MAVVRILVAVIGVLPLDMGDSLCRVLAKIAAGSLGIRRRVTRSQSGPDFPVRIDRTSDNI